MNNKCGYCGGTDSVIHIQGKDYPSCIDCRVKNGYALRCSECNLVWEPDQKIMLTFPQYEGYPIECAEKFSRYVMHMNSIHGESRCVICGHTHA